MQSNIKFDDTVLRKKIKTLVNKLNIDHKQFIREQAGLLAVDLGKYAPPFKKFPSIKQKNIATSDDIKAGEKAILGDLNRIFFLPDNNAIYNWALKEFPSGRVYTKGKISGLGVAHSLEEMSKHHRRFQNPVTGRIGRVSKENRLWVSKKLFTQYYNLQKKEVGQGKAAFAKAALGFNPKLSRRISQKVKRHVATATTSFGLKNQKSLLAGVFMARGYGLQKISSKTINFVLKNRYENMEEQLAIRFQKSARKSGWKVRIR